ncbi:MAG: 5-methylcytosine restriction system specificity protein McrC [Bacteroidia bacterium]
MGIRLSEHKSVHIRSCETKEESEDSAERISVLAEKYSLYESLVSKPFNNSSHCFLIEQKEAGIAIKADYCVGIDWLGNTGRHLYVEPKINQSAVNHFVDTLAQEVGDLAIDEGVAETTESGNTASIWVELDYLKMLLQVTKVPESNVELNGLVQIDWEAKHITIEQNEDRLTPFLVVRFLQTLKSIVRKGLKKNYYTVQENLSNRIKGKILVGPNIKQNVFKNRMTSTLCEYQVYGADHTENRYLKKVLQFCIGYVENHKILFGEKNFATIQHTISFCRPAFELISADIQENELKHIKHNPFFRDYREALQTGAYILKRFAYTISQTAEKKVSTPPFWIDMPRLFELYVFSKMIEHNPDRKKEIHYQFSTYGNALDILISHSDFRMVIDAKYKLKYQKGHLHADIRQVAGYARLNIVREKLKVLDDSQIDCLIIYPDMENGQECLALTNIMENRNEIGAYHKVYKLGVKLPMIETSKS